MMLTDDKINRRFYCRTKREAVSNLKRLVAEHHRPGDRGSFAPPADAGLDIFRNRIMAGRHQVTINGNCFLARDGELLLDAALTNGIDLPYDCRAGHCGTCCVRLVSGEVRGGE